MIKNIISAIFIFVVMTATASSQNVLSKGKMQFNAGFGLSGWGVPLYAGIDYGVHPDVSVGGEVSFRSFSENLLGYKYSYTVWSIAANGNYHFNRVLSIPREGDLYAGLSLGMYFWSLPAGYVGSYNSGLGLGVQVGGRYYFSNTFGINLEVGGGNVAGGKLGVTVKL